MRLPEGAKLCCTSTWNSQLHDCMYRYVGTSRFALSRAETTRLPDVQAPRLHCPPYGPTTLEELVARGPGQCLLRAVESRWPKGMLLCCRLALHTHIPWEVHTCIRSLFSFVQGYPCNCQWMGGLVGRREEPQSYLSKRCCPRTTGRRARWAVDDPLLGRAPC